MVKLTLTNTRRHTHTHTLTHTQTQTQTHTHTQGEAAEDMFFISRGHANICDTRYDDELIMGLGQGDYIGGMACLSCVRLCL